MNCSTNNELGWNLLCARLLPTSSTIKGTRVGPSTCKENAWFLARAANILEPNAHMKSLALSKSKQPVWIPTQARTSLGPGKFKEQG